MTWITGYQKKLNKIKIKKKKKLNKLKTNLEKKVISKISVDIPILHL